MSKAYFPKEIIDETKIEHTLPKMDRFASTQTLMYNGNPFFIQFNNLKYTPESSEKIGIDNFDISYKIEENNNINILTKYIETNIANVENSDRISLKLKKWRDGEYDTQFYKKSYNDDTISPIYSNNDLFKTIFDKEITFTAICKLKIIKFFNKTYMSWEIEAIRLDKFYDLPKITKIKELKWLTPVICEDVITIISDFLL